MARSILESALASTLPSFADVWDAQRRAYPPGAGPSEADLLATLRAHVVQLLAQGRVSETTRFLYALERLLGEADPVLLDLLEADLIAPLAADCLAAGIALERIQPHLGRRSREAWERSVPKPPP